MRACPEAPESYHSCFQCSGLDLANGALLSSHLPIKAKKANARPNQEISVCLLDPRSSSNQFFRVEKKNKIARELRGAPEPRSRGLEKIYFSVIGTKAGIFQNGLQEQAAASISCFRLDKFHWKDLNSTHEVKDAV